jgi:hypothetical protein
MLDSHPAEGEALTFKGSMVIAVGESAEAVEKLLSQDIYATTGVWDMEKAQIIPVSHVFYIP